MKKHSLYKSVAIIAFAGVASGAFANPIAPWHNPSTPQNYRADQIWGNQCAPKENWEKRIKKRAGKAIKPDKIKGEGLHFSTESWHVKKLLGLRASAGSYDFLSAKVKDGRVEYFYTIQRGGTTFSYARHPSLNISSLDVKIDEQIVSFGNVRQFQSTPLEGTGAMTSYSSYATSEIPVDQRLIDYVANQPDSSFVLSTIWIHDGGAVGCPNYLHPAEFRAIRDAVSKAVAG